MINSDNIRSFFKSDFPLNRDGVEELISSFEHKFYPKNTILLREKSQEQHLRFLNDGIVRECYRTDSKEVNTNFYTRPQFISDLSSFLYFVKTRKYQEAITEVSVLEISQTTFNQLLDKYSCGKSFMDQSFQKILDFRETFEYNRRTKSPEQLYHELQVYKPHWLQEIPQYHIASYLGITPETLSRIRKRIS